MNPDTVGGDNVAGDKAGRDTIKDIEIKSGSGSAISLAGNAEANSGFLIRMRPGMSGFGRICLSSCRRRGFRGCWRITSMRWPG
jgi:hypothetical protein